jgi:hypothetical protein
VNIDNQIAIIGAAEIYCMKTESLALARNLIGQLAVLLHAGEPIARHIIG